MWTYLNGDFVKKEEVKISPFDRGFLFGDGVYEVIPSYGRNFFLYDDHLERLKRSLSAINIDPLDNLDNLKTLLVELYERNEFDNQSMYIQVTRGVDVERSHKSSSKLKPTLFISSSELNINPYRLNPEKKGLIVGLDTDIRWKRCDIKAITLLPNIIPYHDNYSSDLDETLLHDNNLINEGTSSNVFFVFGDQIVTPPKNQNILQGVTRNYLLSRLSGKGFSVLEKKVSIEDLNKVDEVWMTSSTKEIQPVHNIEDLFFSKRTHQESLWHKALKVIESDLEVYS